MCIRDRDKDDARDDHKTGDECGGELSSGERASAGARIGRVDTGVGEAVEGHRGRARGEHGDYDPEQLVCSGKPGGSEHCATKSEGQSEDRVLPLDHLESDAKIPQDGHKKIVRQISEMCIRDSKKDAKTGKRKNLGTFSSQAAAKKHERAVQYFKRAG